MKQKYKIELLELENQTAKSEKALKSLKEIYFWIDEAIHQKSYGIENDIIETIVIKLLKEAYQKADNNLN